MSELNKVYEGTCNECKRKILMTWAWRDTSACGEFSETTEVFFDSGNNTPPITEGEIDNCPGCDNQIRSEWSENLSYDKVLTVFVFDGTILKKRGEK
ncbi:MAG: hypothetical protein GY928_33695 [Colwellia sp.]|nr:hypothetical protein [Colwellia sp.]